MIEYSDDYLPPFVACAFHQRESLLTTTSGKCSLLCDVHSYGKFLQNV